VRRLLLLLTLDSSLATGYKSLSQVARRVSEHWGLHNLYCSACDSDHLTPSPNNTPAIDFVCPQCGQNYQLKSRATWSERKVADADYEKMMAAVLSDMTPNLGNYILDKTSSESGTLRTLSDLIRERGGLLSVFDLLEFMKDFDVNVVIRTMLFLGSRLSKGNVARTASYDKTFNMNALSEFCKRLELLTSEKNTDDIISLITAWKEGAPPDLERFNELTDRLASSFSIELSAQSLLSIEPSQRRLWKQPLGGWDETVRRLPPTANDISDASKCLAMGLPTAVVLHLSRVLEVGLKSLVDIFLPRLKDKKNQGWESILKAMSSAVDESGQLSDAEKLTLKEYHIRISRIKDVWRNPTMHVEEGQRYSDAEAEDIYDAVRSFMNELSKKLPPLPDIEE